jgi:DNA polymerase I-like protein with 3'-5' exonuclease and polymerase domains
LIQPPPGYGLAYLDFEQQEFAIAVVYSRDPAMLAAYESGDPYMTFAVLAGAAQVGATKATHKAIRDQYKACVLATQYGMGAQSFASRVNRPLPYARELLRHHHETFDTFWKWSDRVVNHFVQTGSIHTAFGWRRRLSKELNVRSVRNFPMQSGGAEMLRLACCLATERGIEVCAPVHDAVLIAAPLQRLDENIARMQAVMRAASRAVLGGFEVRVEATAVRHPDRFMDPRGEVMWRRIMTLLAKIDGQLRAAA